MRGTPSRVDAARARSPTSRTPRRRCCRRASSPGSRRSARFTPPPFARGELVPHRAPSRSTATPGSSRSLRYVVERGLRRDDQPDDRRGPDRRRRRARASAACSRALRLRRRRQPADHHVPRLPAADRRPTSRSSSTGPSSTPAPTNPGGHKGVGEGGAIGSVPAVFNAVGDALAPLGVTVTSQPLGPNDIFELIHANDSRGPRT